MHIPHKLDARLTLSIGLALALGVASAHCQQAASAPKSAEQSNEGKWTPIVPASQVGATPIVPVSQVGATPIVPVSQVGASPIVPVSQVVSSPVSAPNVRRLTLDEARILALNNNKGLALARLNLTEKGHATDAARKDYFPKLVGVDSYFHFNDNLGSVVTFQTGRLGVLPVSSHTVNAAVLNQDTNLGSVMVVQPITKLLAVNAAVQLARADQGAAQAKLDKGTRDLLSGVAQAYYALLGAQRIQSALELQSNVLDQLLRAKPTPELRIGSVETRQGIVQVRGQLRELTDQLSDLLNEPPGSNFELVDPVPGEPAVRSPEEAAQRAVACNPEIREAEQDIAKAEAAMKVARMAYLPDVNVMGGYANQTGASYIQPNIGFFGLSANYTFFEWGKRRDVTRQRQMDIAMARQNVQIVVDKVQLEARKAYGSYEQAKDEYRLAGEMVQARKDAEKGAGAQTKADTAKAELEAMKAEIAYRVAHAQLMAIVGE
jgi:outer membrane protein